MKPILIILDHIFSFFTDFGSRYMQLCKSQYFFYFALFIRFTELKKSTQKKIVCSKDNSIDVRIIIYLLSRSTNGHSVVTYLPLTVTTIIALA